MNNELFQLSLFYKNIRFICDIRNMYLEPFQLLNNL
jgi:hypothetical protein